MCNIKNIGSFSTIVALALAIAGCNKMAVPEAVTGFPEDGVVRITATADEPQTRADGSEYDGSTLGLFIDYGSGTENARYSHSNVKWTKGTDGWTPEKRMLWKNSTASAAIYAYAPYIDGATDAKNLVFSIPADQSAGTTAADLVSWGQDSFAPNDNNTSFVGGKIQISFSHRLVKMTFNFGKGNQFGSDVTVKEVVLLGTTSKVLCDATTDKNPAVTAHSDAASLDITLHKLDELKYEAVFFPGKGQEAGVKMLKVTMSDGTVLFYTVPGAGLVSGGLIPGSAYTMTMRLGKDKIELAKDGITVGEWGDSGSLTGGEADVDPKADVWDGKTVTPFSTGDSENPLGDLEATPILIENAAQLAYLAEQVNGGNTYQGKYFKLAKDIALANKPWTPIGAEVFQKEFKGNFDGGGHTIYGLKVKGAGLFGYVNGPFSGGTKRTYIKDVKISGADVTSETAYSGILCGAVGNVKISGVDVSGTIIGEKDNCGGIVGYITNSEISNCNARAKVTGVNYVGGLCGYLYKSEVSSCSVSSGEIAGESYNIGGLFGRIHSKCTVQECTVDTNVKGKRVGGLFGSVYIPMDENIHILKNCIMTGTITVMKDEKGQEQGGGLVGALEGKSQFENCGFDGTIVKEEGVDANKVKVGAAIGIDDSGECTFTGCWYNADKTTGLYKLGSTKNPNADYSGIQPKY